MPIVLIVAAIGLFIGFINPQYQTLLANRQVLAANNSALTNSRQITDVREKLRAKYTAVNPDDIARLQKMLPDSVDNVRLILDLDNMATARGMALRNVKVGDSTAAAKAPAATAAGGKPALGPDTNPWGSIQLSFTVSGTYDNFVSYLQDIEHSLRIVDVSALSVKATASGSVYDYDITLRTYWLK